MPDKGSAETLWAMDYFARFTYRDRGSWKKTLHEKAMFFERNTKERHNILGSYPSSVRLVPPVGYAGEQDGAWQRIIETGELPPGWTFDHGTTGLSNVAHTSSWTACLMTVQAFRVAFLRKAHGEESEEYQEAIAWADEVIQSFRILTLVSGQPGYLARGVALGHGVSYEEREGAGTRDLWAQGAGEFRHLRYRGGPSHHNYDQVFRGLGIYYFVAANEAQKEKVREIVADMSDWAHLKNNLIVKHLDGERISTELIGGWRGLEGDDRPSGGSVMALAGMKIAGAIVGNEEVKALYETWVERLGLRDPARNEEDIMGSSRGNYDDTDHLLGDLYLLNLLEEDEVLRTFYRKCVEDSWQVHRDEKMAWFNFVYGVVLGEEYGDLEGSRWNLQMHPTCRILQPQMNSLRTDLEFFEGAERREALHPLPVHERASDNEYEWKGSPFRLDGWTSRIVALMEVSPHDPYVQVATDAAGQMYWSNTQGETWHAVEGVEGVRDVLFSPDYPWMVFAATDTGVYRTMDGGVRWENVFSKRVQEVRFRVENTQVLYAVGPEGVYRSEDLGEWDLGTVWQKVNGDGPSGAVFAVDVGGEEATVYMLTRRGLFAQAEHEQEWKAFPQISRQRGFSTVDPIGGDPLWLRVDPKVHGRLFRAVNSERSGVVVSVSEDGGHAWSPVVRELKPLMDWAVGTYQDVISGEELHRLREVMRAYPIRDLRVDPGNPDVWYGLMEKGVAVTRDAGVSWEVSIKGLDIPQVAAIWTPRHADLVMAGTPAGMYVSLNQAASWTDTSLILQEPGALRAEIGGVGYLTAYWMGRYHGFITEEQANAVWWKDA